MPVANAFFIVFVVLMLYAILGGNTRDTDVGTAVQNAWYRGRDRAAQGQNEVMMHRDIGRERVRHSQSERSGQLNRQMQIHAQAQTHHCSPYDAT